jgi:ectoine hydroxylase-related dioxygenase (phytanoyl-CoA dioxygenase family)
MDDLRHNLDVLGFSMVPDLLDPDEIDSLIAALSAVDASDAVRKRGGVYAIRNLLAIVPAVARLATSDKLVSLVQSALGKDAFAVRGTLFDKTPDANWLVPWHQDLTICLKQRIDAAGFGPWTIKACVHHVQPPIAILEAMLAVRIHLDDCNERNGALRILPSTHHSGRFTAEQVDFAQRSNSPVTCSVRRGGAVLMKPLVLHASSAAVEPAHRRVIHIDYALPTLPSGLEWFAE